MGDEIHDRLVGREGPAAPVESDPGEQPMLDLVPFAGAGWIMTDDDIQAGGGGQPG